MKVLHVIPSVASIRGGPSFAIRSLTSGLAAAGVTVHRASTNDNGPAVLGVPLEQPIQEDGVTCFYFARQTRFYTTSLPFHLWVRKHIKEYDIVHIHAVFSHCSSVAAYEAARQGVPFIIRPLGVLNRWGIENRRPWIKQISLRFIESKLIDCAALMHYTSEQERLEAALAGVTRQSIIVSNATEIPVNPTRCTGLFRSKHSSVKDKKIILFLSRIDAKKGLDLLVDALPRIVEKEPNAVLVIAGNGDRNLVADLKHRAGLLGMSSFIEWVGFLEGEQKEAAYADADLFVLPSYSENFGIAVVEALAYGLPVVVSDQVAVHREIGAAEAGLVTACDPIQIADAILRILHSPALHTKLKQNARLLAERAFSRESMVRSIMAAYETTLQADSQAATAS